MKKNMKKLFASVLSAALVLSSMTLPAKAAEESTESYHAFIAIGADGEAAGDWGLAYYGDGAESNAGVESSVEGELKNGETTTISVTFSDTVTKTWFVAPCMVTDQPDYISPESTFDVKVFLDGEEIETDLSVGKSCWAEDTDTFVGNCVRIGGGYNEWADKYIAESPAGYQTISFEITPHILIANPTEGNLSEEEYQAFIGIGAANDWSLGYTGPNGTPNGVVEAVDGVLKSGETTTISVTFEKEADYTWWVAPCMIIDDPSTVASNTTFEVKTFIDDVEVETDLTAGKNFWQEDTDTYVGNCLRIAGGYNEWGDKFIAESPAGYTKISFEITPMIYIAEAEVYVSAAGPVDVNGQYNAYIGFQTPKYSFRNAFDDATYGRDSEFFQQITGWDADNNAMVVPGTLTDAVIAGNGTYTVSAEGLVFPDGEFESQDFMNLIFLSTDIPNTNEIVISDVELKVDGKSVEPAAGGVIISPDSKDYLCMMIQNTWNEDVKTIGYYGVPMNSMSITFTVSGFAYDKAEEVKAEVVEESKAQSAESTETVAETTAETVTESESGSNTGLIIAVIAVVVVAAVVVGVVVSKKKKTTK